MPKFTSGDQPPPWCEMTAFRIETLPPGSRHRCDRETEREKLIVGRGACRVAIDDEVLPAETGAVIDLPTGSGGFTIDEVREETVVVRLLGHWGEETGGSGLFAVSPSAAPADRGDPTPYAKDTDFDSHYHDCDEYWIILEGSGVAVSEGVPYEVGPGDCVATGMGHHHDFPKVDRPVRAVYFETTLEGEKRRGHLWEHTHGPARPMPDRV